jgi:hypothetical protein
MNGSAGYSVHAQDYPTKPVTFITPAAAGNSPDVVTRVVADRLTQLWKQQIVVLQSSWRGRDHRRPGRRRREGWLYPLHDAGIHLHRFADHARRQNAD